MELNRSIIVKKINLFSMEENKEELINLLCDILDVDNALEYYDLILMIIDIAELYGYQEFIKNKIEQEKRLEFRTISNIIRRDLYRSKHNSNIYFNSGQLSLLTEMDDNDRIFISAPTSFGKTSLILEHIAINNTKYNSIVFLAPTNALVEELYLKFLKLNKENNLHYHIITIPKKCEGRTIWILTPEKFLLLMEEFSTTFDLIVMDESYKIENDEELIEEDILNSRSSKYRKVMEFMGNSESKIIFLSSYTYIKKSSMNRFLDKYNIKSIDRNINYVKKSIIDISNNENYSKYFVDSKYKIYKKDSGIKKAMATLPLLKDNTIIYVMYPSEALKILSYFTESKIEIIEQNERFSKFYHHLKNTYLFEDSNWYIIDALEKGIGIYVSPIPRYIKKEIINLFNLGLLKVLIVTTAFAEGVNSSAKNIIITNRIAGANKKLSNLDILNLSGRAGRFGIHSKGYIYSAIEEVTNILEESSDVGVKIENPNYEFIEEGKHRTDYEIDMIDNVLLNVREKSIKEDVEREQYILGLTDEDLNIALSVSKKIKIKLYRYFKLELDILNLQDTRYNYIKDLLSSERADVIKAITFIFNELKNADIPIVSDFGDIQPYNKNGEFIWGIFYGIHASGDIKNVLRLRKKYISEQLNNIKEKEKIEFKNLKTKEIKEILSLHSKNWISEYLTDGNIDDFKLYNGAFKFISNIIEYRIPFYIGLYISVFKMLCNKNHLIYNFDFDIVEISSSLENKAIDRDCSDMLEFGLPIDTIKKIQKFKEENDLSSVLDDYEKIMLQEFRKYY